MVFKFVDDTFEHGVFSSDKPLAGTCWFYFRQVHAMIDVQTCQLYTCSYSAVFAPEHPLLSSYPRHLSPLKCFMYLVNKFKDNYGFVLLKLDYVFFSSFSKRTILNSWPSRIESFDMISSCINLTFLLNSIN